MWVLMEFLCLWAELEFLGNFKGGEFTYMVASMNSITRLYVKLAIVRY